MSIQLTEPARKLLAPMVKMLDKNSARNYANVVCGGNGKFYVTDGYGLAILKNPEATLDDGKLFSLDPTLHESPVKAPAIDSVIGHSVQHTASAEDITNFVKLLEALKPGKCAAYIIMKFVTLPYISVVIEDNSPAFAFALLYKFLKPINFAVKALFIDEHNRLHVQTFDENLSFIFMNCIEPIGKYPAVRKP